MKPFFCPSCGYQLRNFEAISLGNVSIRNPGRICFNGTVLELPPTQYILADALIRSDGRGLARSTLANMLGSDVNDNSVIKYIERLRSSFRRIDPGFNQIESLRGFAAYRWKPAPLRHAREAGNGLPQQSINLDHQNRLADRMAGNAAVTPVNPWHLEVTSTRVAPLTK